MLEHRKAEIETLTQHAGGFKMNITISAEEAKHNAAYRLESLAVKAERKGDLNRAQELRRRSEFLRSK